MSEQRTRSDEMAVLFLAAVIVGLFVFWRGEFVEATKRWPYPMGFLKLFVLGTFGTMIKNRLRTGSYWKVPHLLGEAVIWGIWGMWFTLIFPLCAGGTEAVITKHLWPEWTITLGFLPWKPNLWLAFSQSLMINILSGYAFMMMIVHGWLSSALAKKVLNPVLYLSGLDFGFWGSFVPKSIFVFWLPAHTITFLLPPEFRVVSAALLAIVLALLISFGQKK